MSGTSPTASVADHLLRADERGPVIVHAADPMPTIEGQVMSAATVAVDLAESDDHRLRRAGYSLLDRLRHE
jgi:hypothetical protein